MKLAHWRRGHGRKGGDDPMGLATARFRNELDTLFDRFFGDSWSFGDWEHPLAGVASFPCVDLAESDDDVTVTMELPGIEAEDVDIGINGDVLTVSGEKKHEDEEKKKDYHYVERHFGRFHRYAQLPSSVDPDSADATFKKGVLKIALKKRSDAKAKRIAVRST